MQRESRMPLAWSIIPTLGAIPCLQGGLAPSRQLPRQSQARCHCLGSERWASRPFSQEERDSVANKVRAGVASTGRIVDYLRLKKAPTIPLNQGARALRWI